MTKGNLVSNGYTTFGTSEKLKTNEEMKSIEDKF